MVKVQSELPIKPITRNFVLDESEGKNQSEFPELSDRVLVRVTEMFDLA